MKLENLKLKEIEIDDSRVINGGGDAGAEFVRDIFWGIGYAWHSLTDRNSWVEWGLNN